MSGPVSEPGDRARERESQVCTYRKDIKENDKYPK